MTTDRIEKQILLRAPLARVWQAISESSQFGAWFGLRCDGPFEAGRKLRCTIVPTTVDPEVAAQQKPYEGVEFDLWIERIEPRHHLSFRWFPFDAGDGADPETAPATLVSFDLTEQDDGVWLKITESGFDRVPPEHRAKAFSGNDEGWTLQLRNIEGFLARASAD